MSVRAGSPDALRVTTRPLRHRRPGLLTTTSTLALAVVATTVVATVPGNASPGGPSVRDDVAGLDYALPAGWTALPAEERLFGISSGGMLDGTRPGTVLMIGVVPPSLDVAEPPLPTATRRLAGELGEFFLPVPGRREYFVDEETTVDGRSARVAGYRVMPTGSAEVGADVQVTVVEDGTRRLFVLVVVGPPHPDRLAAANESVSSIRFR
jgi:hypothetical protein